MGTIIAAIIGGAVAIGTTAAGASASQSMADDANARSLKLYNQQRIDEKSLQADQKELNKWEQNYRQNQLSFQKSEAAEGRKERKDQFNYQKRQQQFNTSLGIVNSSQQAKNTFFNLWNRRKAA